MPVIGGIGSPIEELDQGTAAESIAMGITANNVIRRFNDMIRNLGGVVKTLQELLLRQGNQKIERPSVELSEEKEEWIISVPDHEDRTAVQTALLSVDTFVIENNLKDRSSGIEDLLSREVCHHELSAESPAVAKKLGEMCKGDSPTRSQSPDTTNVILVLVEMNGDSTHTVCSFCNETFLSRKELEEHIFMKHNVELSFPESFHQDRMKCPLCEEFHESKTSLQEHCRQNHLRHVSFTENGNLKMSPNELKKCPQCDYIAMRKGRMSTHLRKAHQIVEDIVCEICKKSFNSHRTMTHHFQQLHTMINSKCSICGKVCKNRAAYQNHSLAHSRIFHCKYCDKAFNNRRCFTQHEKRHLTKAVHICNYCGHQFKVKSNLERHIRVLHLTEVKFSCDSCLFTTFYKDNLKEHINKVHFGVMKGKFSCHHCNKAFSRRAVYEEHMDRHEGKFRYSCEICGKKFRNKSRCNQHVLSCSGTGRHLRGGDITSSTENSTLCVVGAMNDTMPDPDNLSLIVAMDFVQGDVK